MPDDHQTTGHGHVTPNPDGLKARCGGPAMCSVCQKEASEKLTATMNDLVQDTATRGASVFNESEGLTLEQWIAFKRRLTLISDPRRN